MSPGLLLPVTENSTAKTTTKKAEYTTTAKTTSKMANSNASHRQAMGQTGQQGGQGNNTTTGATVTSTATGAGDVVDTSTLCANKTKSIRTIETTATKEMPASLTTSLANVASTNVITTSQCDSSSGSSTTSSINGSSSGGSDVSSINVKSETCDTEIKIENEAPENGSAKPNVPSDANDLQLAAMKHRPILLSSMNAHIICGLCFGYLIEATTIVECLHSFCHSCLIKHLRTEQYCPRCEMMINTAKPNIKPDTTLQAIVYKLVPGLYERELMRKRAFYKDRPEEAALATPEQRGDDTEHLIFSPSDYMSISLEYADIDDLLKSNTEYSELLKPRYLQCPAMCTVAHLKKLVFGKFEINSHRFTIDIMYKVKTIILLDHYTLMDVAYIYTWKRDAPMRFYFRVKQSLRPTIRVKKNQSSSSSVTKKEEVVPAVILPPLQPQPMCIVHEPTPSLVTTTDSKILEPEEIKQEDEAEVSSTTEIPAVASLTSSSATSAVTTLPPPKPPSSPPAPIEKPKQFEIVQPQSPSISSHEVSPTDKLKITIVNKAAKDKSHNSDVVKPYAAPQKAPKDKKESHKISPSNSSSSSSFSSVSSIPKDERKVENIKLKIDLSKQNSVTIINMSDPQRKEIVKSVKPEKEWKVTKTKKEKDGNAKSSPKSSVHSERKNKTSSNLTVPPITIKAERISPLANKVSSAAMSAPKSAEDYQKSQFLKSFALAPINELKLDKPEQQQSRLLSKEVTLSVVPRNPMKDLSGSSSSKRKSKEPIKAVIKKPRLSPPLAKDHFKIKLPLIPPNPQTKGVGTSVNSNVSSTTTTTSSSSSSKKNLMPPPAPLTSSSTTAMKPPSSSLMKKTSGKLQQNTKMMTAAPPGSLTPHPMHGGIQLAPPGSRTPIAKRYQPILPKASRPNPFANIPSDVNKILKNAGTEIKSIPNETSSKPMVYGPKTDASTLMGPPSMAAPSSKSMGSSSGSNTTSRAGSSKSAANKNNNNNNSYLNLALYNATKSKGNEAPPGCRTPMYTPNSPIYSPSSPQYVPNYNIPTVPTYKYTPKPANANNSYLQSVFNCNNKMSNLFPSPPTKKDSNNSNNASASNSNSSSSSATNNSRSESHAPKRVYPFARSPSPVEDPPEKQLKVKSLLNSCNINIPSSLSITITREDGDPSSNGAQYPKHKSPVNNYIEILKLPEQTSDNNGENKRSSPPIASSLFPNPPVKRVATPPLNANNKAINHNNNNHNNNNHSNTNNNNNNNTSINNKQKSISMNGGSSQLNVSPKTVPGNNNTSNANNHVMNSKTSNNGMNKPIHNNNKSPLPSNKSPPCPLSSDKKTPSPEKRLSSGSAEQKSPKSPDGSASKKFRHILPRQMAAAANQQTETKVPKPSGNIIGTYTSPTGVNIKIHSGKKVQAGKKSPGTQQKPQQQQQTTNSSGGGNAGAGNVKNQHQSSPTMQQTSKPTMQTTQQTSNNKSTAAAAKLPQSASKSNKTAATNNANKLLNNVNGGGGGGGAMANMLPTHSSVPPTIPPHPTMPSMLPPHMAAAAAAAAAACKNAAGQAELSKMLKENLLRAQVQAAVANQSNMFYPYAANAAAAAQLGQFNPTMYNYQQAYILDQLSRMQRAGNDAFTEYLQKLKNSMELQKIQLEGKATSGGGSCEGGTKQQAPQQKNAVSPKSISSSSSSNGSIAANAGKEQIMGKSK